MAKLLTALVRPHELPLQDTRRPVACLCGTLAARRTRMEARRTACLRLQLHTVAKHPVIPQERRLAQAVRSVPHRWLVAGAPPSRGKWILLEYLVVLIPLLSAARDIFYAPGLIVLPSPL